MKVYLEKEKKFREVDAVYVGDMLEKLSINPGTVIVVKNGNVVTEDEKIGKNDELRILSVISGG